MDLVSLVVCRIYCVGWSVCVWVDGLDFVMVVFVWLFLMLVDVLYFCLLFDGCVCLLLGLLFGFVVLLSLFGCL